MSMLRYALIASVAACVAGGVAAAQPTQAPPPASDNASAAPPDQAASPPPTQTENATPAGTTSTSSPGVQTSVTVEPNGVQHSLITNGPVPDTKENREKYGQPDSSGGQRTQPAGN